MLPSHELIVDRRASGGSKQLRRSPIAAIGAAAALLAQPARASLFSGDTLDMVADILAWIVLFVAPIIAIGVFLIIHILPEKIAERRRHPQLNAIKTLCILSLFFGGLLWPLAWLWAYTKPTLHKLAYGTDVAEPEPEREPPATSDDTAVTQAERDALHPLQDAGLPHERGSPTERRANRV